MRTPDQPSVQELTHLTPSLYEAARLCSAKAAWLAFGERESVPAHPQGLLGTCVHSVLELGHNGRLPSGTDEPRRAAAREAFDRKATDLWNTAHPLMRSKFPTPERIPFYNLFRERAAALASAAPARSAEESSLPRPAARGVGTPRNTFAERTLRSRDGLLQGRPDFIDVAAGEVTDYKTGAGPDGDDEGLRESEARQLRLYVHLGRENDMDLRHAIVVRMDGRRIGLDVSNAEAASEGQRAREVLGAFNANASAEFNELATPSPAACPNCPCIPFCDAFWDAASPAWREECGTHVEGTVSAVNRAVVQNTELLTLELTELRGTVGTGSGVVQQLPEKWTSADGSRTPAVGDVVRVVNGRLEDGDAETALIHPDRVTTAVWTVGSPEHAAQDDRGPGHG